MPRPSARPTRLAARLHAQLLTARDGGNPEGVVQRLYAVQAQDPRGFRLAIRSRTAGLTVHDVDAALTARRALVVSTLNRGTLHLVRGEDFWDLHAVTTPQLATGSARRLRQEGVDEAHATRGIDVVAAAVAERPRTRAELRSLLDAAGVPTAGQALSHLLFATALEGLAVRGPVIAGEHAFVSPHTWVGPPPGGIDRDERLARLARRYLAGHGPATAGDLARWAGVPLGQARRGLSAIAAETEPFDEETVVLAGTEPCTALPAPVLLGAYEPVLLGWVSRQDIVGPHPTLVTSNGLFRPFALVDGRAVATWTLTGGRPAVTWLEPVPAEMARALDDDARDVGRFFTG